MSASPTSYGPLPESRCPQCDYKLTGASVAHGTNQPPQPGDTSICLNCGQVLTYLDGTLLRKATADEIRELMQEPKAWATIEKAQMFIRRRGRFA
jgi:transcription initiation factor IIE alpha subunit